MGPLSVLNVSALHDGIGIVFFARDVMGNKDSKAIKPADGDGHQTGPKLKRADLEFLKANTNFDEETITEWYTEFLVSI